MRFARFAAATAALTIAVGGFAASATFADPGPKWQDGPFYAFSADNAVTATGSITGVGNGDLTLSLEADVSLSCTNKGGHQPKGHRKSVSGATTYTDVKNGRVDFSVSTDPVEGKKCPGKMTPTVTLIGASLTVHQNGVEVLSDYGA